MSVQRVVVTGVNGFVGTHVVTELVSHGYEVIGFGRESDHGMSSGLAEYVQADLVAEWPRVEQVDAVIHLAGLAAVGPSFDHAQLYIDVNGGMINRLADWTRNFCPQSRAVIVSTGAVYQSAGVGPLHEDSELSMSSPYVVSKLLVENLVGYYRRSGLDWLVARPFNHIGPGQGPGFLLPDLASQLVGDAPVGEVVVGNLKTSRDYTDVRDVARAYRLLAVAPKWQDWIFNVCSEHSRSGEEIFDLLLEALGAKTIVPRVDESRIRPDDPQNIFGSAERIYALTGWRPEIPIETCVQDFVHGLV